MLRSAPTYVHCRTWMPSLTRLPRNRWKAMWFPRTCKVCFESKSSRNQVNDYVFEIKTSDVSLFGYFVIPCDSTQWDRVWFCDSTQWEDEPLAEITAEISSKAHPYSIDLIQFDSSKVSSFDMLTVWLKRRLKNLITTMTRPHSFMFGCFRVEFLIYQTLVLQEHRCCSECSAETMVLGAETTEGPQHQAPMLRSDRNINLFWLLFFNVAS